MSRVVGRWEEFRALPSEEITRDIHCVTKWSKLDTVWRGVSVDTLLDGRRDVGRVRDRSSATAATRPTCRSRTSPAAGRGSSSSMTVSRSSPSTAARRACSSRISTSGRAPSGCAACSCRARTSRVLGDERLPQPRRPMAGAALLGRLSWQPAKVVDVRSETPRVKTHRASTSPGWPGHRAGTARRRPSDGRGRVSGGAQLLDRLGAGRHARRAHGRAPRRRRGLAVPDRRAAARRPDRAARPDRRLLRVGADAGRAAAAVAGGSGIVPLMAMIRAARQRPAATWARSCCSRRGAGTTSSTATSWVG